MRPYVATGASVDGGAVGAAAEHLEHQRKVMGRRAAPIATGSAARRRHRREPDDHRGEHLGGGQRPAGVQSPASRPQSAATPAAAAESVGCRGDDVTSFLHRRSSRSAPWPRPAGDRQPSADPQVLRCARMLSQHARPDHLLGSTGARVDHPATLADMEQWDADDRRDPAHRPDPAVEADGWPVFWAITKHADVFEVSRRSDVLWNTERSGLGPDVEYDMMEVLGSDSRRRALVELHGEVDEQHRQVTNDWFKPAAVKRLQGRIEEIADQYLDRPRRPRRRSATSWPIWPSVHPARHHEHLRGAEARRAADARAHPGPLGAAEPSSWRRHRSADPGHRQHHEVRGLLLRADRAATRRAD